MTKITPGEIRTAEIATILDSSKAAIKAGSEIVTVGPINLDRVEKGTPVTFRYYADGYGILLNDQDRGENYLRYIRSIQDTVISETPPEQGEQVFVEISEITSSGIGIAYFGDQAVNLGPVNANEGDLVEVEGVDESNVLVIKDEKRGADYRPRWNLLAEDLDELPFEFGETSRVTIVEIRDSKALGYIDEYPIRFEDDEVAIGQVVLAEIVNINEGFISGTITEKTDEIRRVPGGNFWTNVQWLRKSGYDENDPLTRFASDFIGVSGPNLPGRDDVLRESLIAEAIRLAVAEKSEVSTDGIDNAYVTSIRHWAVHKLSPLLGTPNTKADGQNGSDEEEDWFQEVLSGKRSGSIVTYGDLLSLRGGYYAPSPTRVIPYSDEEAVVISGMPTAALRSRGIDLDIRGIARIADLSQRDPEEMDVPVQTRDSYLGLEEYSIFDGEFLEDFIKSRPKREWERENEWGCYNGNTGFDYQFSDAVYEVEFQGHLLSLWNTRADSFGGDYWLRVSPTDKEANPIMVPVPRKYSRIICLLLDQVAGNPRTVSLSPLDDEVRVSVEFRLPKPYRRWLHALGALFDNPKHGMIHYRIRRDQYESVVDLFEGLPVDLEVGLT